jgi:hypothetical protein
MSDGVCELHSARMSVSRHRSRRGGRRLPDVWLEPNDAKDYCNGGKEANRRFDALGIRIDQRWLVENCTIPLAVVNGSEDESRYLEVPKYANLWGGRSIVCKA